MKAVSPVVEGLEKHETFKGGPRAGQPQYLELPCLLTKDGGVVSRWELTEHDRRAIADGADIFLTIYTGGGFYPPTRMEILDRRVAYCPPQMAGNPASEAQRIEDAAQHFGGVVRLAEIPPAKGMLRNPELSMPTEGNA